MSVIDKPLFQAQEELELFNELLADSGTQGDHRRVIEWGHKIVTREVKAYAELTIDEVRREISIIDEMLTTEARATGSVKDTLLSCRKVHQDRLAALERASQQAQAAKLTEGGPSTPVDNTPQQSSPAALNTHSTPAGEKPATPAKPVVNRGQQSARVDCSTGECKPMQTPKEGLTVVDGIPMWGHKTGLTTVRLVDRAKVRSQVAQYANRVKQAQERLSGLIDGQTSPESIRQGEAVLLRRRDRLRYWEEALEQMDAAHDAAQKRVINS